MKKFNMPCLYCGTLSRGSACKDCINSIQARDPKRRERNKQYNYEWHKISRIARQIQPWCSRCGSQKDLTADHIISLESGGSNILSNVQVLCRRCNSSKG